MVRFYWEDISQFGKIFFFLGTKIIEVGGLQERSFSIRTQTRQRAKNAS